MTEVNVTPPVVSGSPRVGQTIQTSDGTWTYDLDYLTYTYQWRRCDAGGASCVDIAGATGKSYVIAGADLGHTLRSRVTATEHAFPTPPPTGTVKYASTTGSDSSGDGSILNPYRTMDRLSRSLAPGETGQLRGGAYQPAFTWSTGGQHNGQCAAVGTASQRCVITNYPGEKVTILGTWGFYGAYTTIRNLYVDPTNTEYKDPNGEHCGIAAQVVTFGGSNLIFENCNVYYSGLPGYATMAKASGIFVYNTFNNGIIRNNLIHDVGGCGHHDHGIYVGGGANGQIYGNWIWQDGYGWGIQVYPNPSGWKIHSNVIDRCGSGFVIGDEGGGTCHDNEVYNNVITNSIGMTAISGFHFNGQMICGVGPTGSGNSFHDNIGFNNPDGVGSQTNVAMSNNQIANPLFVDAANHNYTLQPGSPAAGFGLPTSPSQVGPNV